jgi:hypothetical protein
MRSLTTASTIHDDKRENDAMAASGITGIASAAASPMEALTSLTRRRNYHAMPALLVSLLRNSLHLCRLHGHGELESKTHLIDQP